MDGKTGDPGNLNEAPGETRLEKVMRERFGAPALGSLMGGIVDKMFQDLEAKGVPENESDAEDEGLEAGQGEQAG